MEYTACAAKYVAQSRLINHKNQLCPHRYPFTPGWREAIIVMCLAQGHKCHDRDSNPHSAEQNHKSLNWVLFSARPRHPRNGATNFIVKITSVQFALHLIFCLLSIQAPSTSVCLSILDLHSDPRTCGALILQMCRDLSEYLRPIRPGVPNPEVDYNLIIR